MRHLRHAKNSRCRPRKRNIIVPLVHNWLPPVHAQVGDTLQVYFRNTLSFGVNLFLGGGAIPLDSNKATTTVPQGVTFEYTWQVRKVLRKVFTGVRGRNRPVPCIPLCVAALMATAGPASIASQTPARRCSIPLP